MAHPEDLVRRALELTDSQDWPAREALFTADSVMSTPQGVARGPAAMTAYSKPLVGAFSHAVHRIDLIVVDGDAVAVEGAWIATHTGPLVTPDGEVPPTGRTISLPFAATLRLSGGRIASLHLYYDQLAFLGQLGLLPHPQAA